MPKNLMGIPKPHSFSFRNIELATESAESAVSPVKSKADHWRRIPTVGITIAVTVPVSVRIPIRRRIAVVGRWPRTPHLRSVLLRTRIQVGLGHRLKCKLTVDRRDRHRILQPE